MRRYVVYRVIVINGHVGIGIRNGVFPWIRRNLTRRFNLVFAVEANSKSNLVTELGPDWGVYPIKSPDVKAHTYVCLKQTGPLNRKTKRFEITGVTNEDIRHGSKFPRALRALAAWDTKANRMLNLSVFHPDPVVLPLPAAPTGAVRKHLRQVEETVDWHESHFVPGDVDMSGGDANEKINEAWDRYPLEWKRKSMRGMFAKLNMYPAHKLAKRKSGEVRLMELFVRNQPYVKVMRRKSVNTPIQGMDHEVTYVKVRVRKAALK